ACELLEQAERLQRRFFRPAGAARHPAWEPPVDIFETGDSLWIVVALPGVALEQVRILVDGSVLTVIGERPLPRQSQGGAIHRVEIPHGYFERRLPLPRGRFELADRTLRDGCLTLTLHKIG